MNGKQPWCPGPDGKLATWRHGFRLVIHECAEQGLVRFVVLGRGGEGQGPALLASGTRDSVAAAMRASEGVAARMGSVRAV